MGAVWRLAPDFMLHKFLKPDLHPFTDSRFLSHCCDSLIVRVILHSVLSPYQPQKIQIRSKRSQQGKNPQNVRNYTEVYSKKSPLSLRCPIYSVPSPSPSLSLSDTGISTLSLLLLCFALLILQLIDRSTRGDPKSRVSLSRNWSKKTMSVPCACTYQRIRVRLPLWKHSRICEFLRMHFSNSRLKCAHEFVEECSMFIFVLYQIESVVWIWKKN